MNIDSRIEPADPFPAEYIQEIEDKLKRKLPLDYSEFLTSFGGAFVGGFVDNSDNLPISAFFDNSEDYGVVRELQTRPDLDEFHILPIASCALGNIYVINTDNSIHYINYYGGETKTEKVSNSFSDFVKRIVVRED